MREYFYVLFVYLFVDLVGFGGTDMVHVAHHVSGAMPVVVGEFRSSVASKNCA